AGVPVLDAIRWRGDEHVGPALELVPGPEWRLERTVARSARTAEQLLPGCEPCLAEPDSQFHQVVVAVEVPRVAVQRILPGELGRVVQPLEGAGQANAGGGA